MTSAKPSRSARIKNPLLFQGWGTKKNYFEGWYYKFVDREHNIAFDAIPGISLNDDDPHCFIQLIDGIKCMSSYHRFDINDFKCNNKIHHVQIKGNRFSKEELILDLPEIQCELNTEVWNGLPNKWYRPEIMGLYSYIPTMQCNHGLGSMDHSWSGSLCLNQQDYAINKAKGYVEKDWGSSFPKSWIWRQCNSFDNQTDLSVFGTITHIQWMKQHFIGFLGAIYIDGEIEVFSTYTGAKRISHIRDNKVTVEYKHRKSPLIIEATQAEGAELISPISGTIRRKVNESLLAQVEITYKSKNNTIRAIGQNAGMELRGEIDELLTK